jgi:hypothetical protein
LAAISAFSVSKLGSEKDSARLELLLGALFQQNSQFRNCFPIFWSACRFLDADQCGQIKTFEANTESIDVEGMG